jgi:ParB/RepB/Spo0J family partition protein
MIITATDNPKIPIDKIIEPEWDIRQDTKSDKDSDNNNFAALVQTIKKHGVIQPIVVSKTETDKYEIVAGRRRFKACKMLGLMEIPAVVRAKTPATTTTTTENDKDENQIIALVENLHRKDLSDIEKANGILSIYTNAGYQDQDVIRLIKFLDNNGYQPDNTTTDRNRILSLLGKRSLTKKDTNNSKNEPIITEKFLDIVDSIGYSPNTQYKYLQIVVNLKPEILKKAETIGLNINKKNMLINKELNKHPHIQKNLIDQIKYKPEKEARKIVAQEIRDLETGATIKHGNSYLFDDSKREKIDTKISTEKSAAQYYLEINEKLNELMYLLTGHKLAQDETCFDPNHVDNTQKHRTDIVKGLTRNEALNLENKADIVNETLSSLLDIINQEVK